ncbi:MAG: methionine synthase, partial [Candidatus Omnitrophica bacterium]|nr:methionine synthase [Candidatus Omnitrophota bacterium]
GAREALRERRKDLALMAHCTLANNGRMLLGTEVSAFMSTLSYLGADVIGLNCSTGPVEMEPSLKFLSEKCPARISCVPNAGLPIEEDGRTVYPMGPGEMAGIMSGFVKKYRPDIIGGCCGTEPVHIKAIREKLGERSAKRKVPPNTFCSGSYRAFDLVSAPRPVKVGERINTQGSRRMKELLLADDLDGIIELGKSQQRAGADILDVCSVLTERDTEKKDAVTLIKHLAESVQPPLMIDSTDTGVIEAALENYPGTAFINSANLEDGGEKARRIFAMAVEHGAFTVLLAIDREGMARTVDKKLEIARALRGIAVDEFGLEENRLAFDMLTFSLGTGEKEYADSAVNTFRAVKQLKKEFPGVLALSGVSNCSFGLGREARKVLNMVYLHHAVLHGLDIAIVNPAEYIPYQEIDKKEAKLAEDLIFNRRGDALQAMVDHFEKMAPATGPGTAGKEQRRLSPEEEIRRCVLERDKVNIIKAVDAAAEKHPPENIINEILMPAMKEVGDKLDCGEMVLPYVLQAAETMKKAIDHLEPVMAGSASGDRGKVLLATVKGDVHDIGKNLVKMVLRNNGFEVIDLGKQVPVEKIVEEAEKNRVDAVGLSALLVSTARHMKTCVQAMHEAGMDQPVIIGGAPVNERYAREVSVLKDKSLYRGGVFYARDAFTGLKIMQSLKDPEALRSYAPGEDKAVGKLERQAPGVRKKKKGKRKNTVTEVPFYGIRPLNNIPADEVFRRLNEDALFRMGWGAKLKDEKERDRLIESEFKPLLEEFKEKVIREGWLGLKAVYGYFKCRARKTEADILDQKGRMLEKISFNELPGGRCLTDYLAEEDVVAFQAVTIGEKMSEAVREAEEAGDHTGAYYLHGFSVHLAEALASYIFSHILGEMSLEKDGAKRYSPGYPLWKDLSSQEKIFRLLEVEPRLGIKLTGGYQMIPEQSTTAMIIFDPEAEY